MASILGQKGIPTAVDDWGKEWPHGLADLARDAGPSTSTSWVAR
jgi:hypothetical protein